MSKTKYFLNFGVTVLLKCNYLVLETRNLSKDAFELLKIYKEIFRQYLASYPYGRTGTYCPFRLQVQLITPRVSPGEPLQ